MAITSKSLHNNGKQALLRGLLKLDPTDSLTLDQVWCTGSGIPSDPPDTDTVSYSTPTSSGTAALSSAIVINVPAGATITGFNFGRYAAVPYIAFTVNIDSEVFTYAGTITITTATLSVATSMT